MLRGVLFTQRSRDLVLITIYFQIISVTTPTNRRQSIASTEYRLFHHSIEQIELVQKVFDRRWLATLFQWRRSIGVVTPLFYHNNFGKASLASDIGFFFVSRRQASRPATWRKVVIVLRGYLPHTESLPPCFPVIKTLNLDLD